MTELHEAHFNWPAGPSKVIVSGSFDNWSSSTELTKTDLGFTGTFHLPWDTTVTYKYVVDGEWMVNPSEPQTTEGPGYINNVYTSPRKPVIAASEPPTDPALNAPAVEKTSMEGAKDTAASVVSYMASGLGAAFASVTGIDPINPQQIPLDDEKAKEVLDSIPVSEPDAKKAEPAPTVGTAHDPLVPEAPIAKALVDALAPIADEPVVLNLLPTTSTVTSSVSNVASTVTETVAAAATTVKESLPATVPETKEIVPSTAQVSDKLPEPITNAVEKVEEIVAPATSIPIPDAVEPHKEASVSGPIPVPDAPETYKQTNGKPPAETEAPTKASETVEKSKETVASGAEATSNKVEEVASKVKETVAGAKTAATNATGKTTPPPSTKHAFPGSETANSVTSSAADGTPKRKKRQSIFGKLKEAFSSPDKHKNKLGSTSS